MKIGVSSACALTAERLRSVLDYDKGTGLWTWLKDGKRAGTRRKDGYVQISVDRRLYLSHRLAWLWMTGDWPPGEIDHCDVVPGNDAWANLRLADRQKSSANTRRRADNKSGFKGVSALPNGLWLACIKKNGRTIHLGRFGDASDAHAAYRAAATNHFGEFARMS